jgi:hypothetical protein
VSLNPTIQSNEPNQSFVTKVSHLAETLRTTFISHLPSSYTHLLQGMNLFGQNKTTFNPMPTTSAGSSYLFGQPAAATNSGSLFGAKPATGTGFGSGFGATAAPAFGTSNNLFGQSFNKPATPGFMFPSTSTTGLGEFALCLFWQLALKFSCDFMVLRIIFSALLV